MTREWEEHDKRMRRVRYLVFETAIVSNSNDDNAVVVVVVVVVAVDNDDYDAEADALFSNNINFYCYYF